MSANIRPKNIWRNISQIAGGYTFKLARARRVLENRSLRVIRPSSWQGTTWGDWGTRRKDRGENAWSRSFEGSSAVLTVTQWQCSVSRTPFKPSQQDPSRTVRNSYRNVTFMWPCFFKTGKKDMWQRNSLVIKDNLVNKLQKPSESNLKRVDIYSLAWNAQGPWNQRHIKMNLDKTSHLSKMSGDASDGLSGKLVQVMRNGCHP